MKQRKEIYSFQTQVRFGLWLNGIFICNHVVDFYVSKRPPPYGIQDQVHSEAHEVKGYKTDVWRLKQKIFKAQYPHIPYVVISKKETKKWKKI